MGSETETQIHHIVNIPEMIEPMLHEQCCIYKVPNHLLKLNEEAFTPKFISIGPFHSHNPELNQEKQKQRYFHAFWKRLSNKQGLALVHYKGFLEETKENIAKCYSKHDVCVLDKFVEMILLDSVFIMELFLRKSNESEQKNDFMFMTSWIYRITQRDLLLLENQIPMFVLEELHKRVLGGNCVSFIELAFNYFEDYYPQKKSLKDEMIRKCESCKHFTDLIRYSYLPRKIQEKGVNQSENFTKFSSEYVLRTATKLNEAGISFEKVQGRSYCDIKFKKTPILNWFLCLGCLPCFRFVESKLRIPHLKVDQSTECVLRNLIALEQCHYSNQPFVCNYVSLIDSLIHTHEDVELLVDTEIVSHELGSHAELATLVNCLCRHVVVTSNCYGEMVKELNEHYNNVWKHYMGMLRSVYFRDPWRLSSTVVGVSIFLFAFVNFLKVIGVFSPKY
ncbi:UPF0481 protein At3g47200 [Lathyrus oleraceus]|uniref:Uncharacterized protein n=1 Tax=Pisum sativum TaxID=3888 RepID=A0A9D4XQR6_PEA|nr:UPF0481 protein At3g47200-like [Pisum sativum]XP_050874476.1 UPF0481 protein At3g47200-like [Pisum sativum]KAI5423360.1 hypothetical protein KIW84_046361 [Pisum sativum]